MSSWKLKIFKNNKATYLPAYTHYKSIIFMVIGDGKKYINWRIQISGDQKWSKMTQKHRIEQNLLQNHWKSCQILWKSPNFIKLPSTFLHEFFELCKNKIYWDHLLDEISSNPWSFWSESDTFSRKRCKQSHSEISRGQKFQICSEISVFRILTLSPQQVWLFAPPARKCITFTSKTPRIWRDLVE